MGGCGCKRSCGIVTRRASVDGASVVASKSAVSAINDNAQKAYTQKQKECKDLFKKIGDALEVHKKDFDKHNTDWSYVGDMTETVANLENILRFIS